MDVDVVAVVRQAHADMDESWQKLLEENSSRRRDNLAVIELACRRGCAACCTYLPDVRLVEARVLAMVVEQGEPAARRLVLLRLYDWREAFEQWLAVNPAPDIRSEREAHLLWRQRWQVLRVACPFLNLRDYSCTVYPDRPHTCRSAHAAYPPSEQYAQPGDGCFSREGELQVHWGFGDQVNVAFSQHMSDALKAAGLASGTGILALEVLAIGEEQYGWTRPINVPRLERSLA